MELIGLAFLFFFLWVIFKVFGAIFYAGAFLITLPLKIIGTVLLVAILIPLGLFTAIVSVISIAIPLLPFALIIMAIVYFNRK
ncbi:MAG: hypothetical protein D8M58_19685 [Calditrichaeota bacterium]|nr:MAG: hypothetical protein DWQ03_22365 [Calditrichota bacterium]MBL1207631.1 hypothetical protein [Calditrichota bacterium]NOG47464.1 hypothetical protein [Calditrichota bacterium]